MSLEEMGNHPSFRLTSALLESFSVLTGMSGHGRDTGRSFYAASLTRVGWGVTLVSVTKGPAIVSLPQHLSGNCDIASVFPPKPLEDLQGLTHRG